MDCQTVQRQNLSKSQAIQLVTAQLDFNLSRKETEKFAALDQYIATLNSYKRLTTEAAQYGTCIAGLTTRGRGVEEPQRDKQDGTSTFLNSLATKKSPKHYKHH